MTLDNNIQDLRLITDCPSKRLKLSNHDRTVGDIGSHKPYSSSPNTDSEEISTSKEQSNRADKFKMSTSELAATIADTYKVFTKADTGVYDHGPQVHGTVENSQNQKGICDDPYMPTRVADSGYGTTLSRSSQKTLMTQDFTMGEQTVPTKASVVP